MTRRICSVFAVCLLYPIPSLAETLYVPADYPTIQGAVDAADHWGDTILVAPGTYEESVRIHEKSLTLRSEAGAEATLIDAGNEDDLLS